MESKSIRLGNSLDTRNEEANRDNDKSNAPYLNPEENYSVTNTKREKGDKQVGFRWTIFLVFSKYI